MATKNHHAPVIGTLHTVTPLCAAAPDLLAALEESLTAWLETQAAHGDVVSRPFLIERLRAAIAKAREATDAPGG